MSGGSWDYFHCRLDEVADRLIQEKQPERRAFGRTLKEAAKVLHAIEWVDSCDWSEPDAKNAITEFLKRHGGETAIVEEALVAAKADIESAIEAVRTITGSRP